MNSSKADEHLQPGELVKRWRNLISLGTLANWRSNGTGPNFLKLGGRILYRRVDVEAWEAEHHCTPKPAPQAVEKHRTPRRASR